MTGSREKKSKTAFSIRFRRIRMELMELMKKDGNINRWRIGETIVSLFCNMKGWRMIL